MFELDAVKIRRLMFAAKFDPATLAKKAGISPPTAAKVIRDGAKVNFSIVGKIADALGVDGNTLIITK